MKIYRKSPGGRAAIKRANQRYRQSTPERKAITKLWRQSPKGIELKRRHREKYKNNPAFKASRKAAAKKYYASPKGQLSLRDRMLKIKYGISVNQYEAMVSSQNNRCAICESGSKNGKRLNIDHDHSSGKVRQLLCHQCNSILGYAGENILVLYKAADYIEKHRRIVSCGNVKEAACVD